MVDVAELVMRGRAEGFDEANAKMRTTTTEAQKVEGAVEGMGRAMSRVDPHVQNMNRALKSAESQAKAMQMAGLNLGRQFTDVGVTLAMGMNPFMVALQQGPQIIDAFQMAALQMGTSVKGAMAAMGTAIWTAMAPLLPFIAAATAAAAVLGGAFALGTRAAGQEIGNLTEGMNLTEKQLKKLKEENVSTTTTMGDVWRGLGTTIKEGFFEVFGDQVKAIDRQWNEFLDKAWTAVVSASKNITGSFVGALYAVRDTWKMLPAALGDAAFSAANFVLRGVEFMINGGVRLLNGLITKANEVASKMGLSNLIPALREATIGSIANPFAGAMAQLGERGAASFGEGFEAGSSFVERAAARLLENIEASGEARIKKALGDTSAAVRDVGSAASEAAVQVERLQGFETVRITPIDLRVTEILDPLVAITEELRLIDGLARDAAYGMADAFGETGRAMGDLLVAASAYQAVSAQIALDAKQGRLTEAQAARQQAALQVQTYGDMASAAKGFFDEQSSGYKALQAVEQVYRAWQFATSVAAIAQGWMETGQSVAQAGVKASADTAAGGAKMFSQLGVYAFPLVAAMVAVMAGLGASNGGSVSTPSLPTTNTGTGTVLGDSGAQSGSIGNSLADAEKYWNRDLQLTNQMVQSLRSIETEIGSMTTLIARQLNVGGGFDTSGLNLGTSTSRSLFGLMSTTRSSSVVGQGLNLNSATLAKLISDGVTGSMYNIIQNTKTKSGFFGIGGGTTTWNTETSTAMDAELGAQLGRILASLRASVLTAAGQLGVDGAEATLDAMVISLGRIDFTGLSSSEISEKLTAVFSAAGDQMALAILPQLQQYQQAGEGMLETLTRLATTFTTIDTTLASMGMTFNAVGLESLDARNRLIELSGGLEAFTDSASFFVSEFLTEAQQIAPIQAAVNAELERLGLSTDITREQFAALVMGIDVSTEAGAALYAALMRLAPSLDAVLDYAEKQEGVVANTAELARQRRQLEIALMEATGDAAGALAARRADELAAMDPSLRALQEQIWAAQEAAKAQEELKRAQEEAAQAAKRIADQRTNLEIALMEALGQSSEALAARRRMELEALDPALRALQLQVWAAEDAAAANEALARAQQEAADKARQLASQRADLEIQLLEAQGRSAEAVAMQRQIELAALDASLRPLQEAIWAQLDLNAAQEAAAEAASKAAEEYQKAQDAARQRIEDARSVLTEAYERESSAIQQTIDKFAAFSDSLREFRNSLTQSTSGSSFEAVQSEFRRISELAKLGNEDALGSLQDVSTRYLDAAMNNAGSALDYQRAVAQVLGAVDAAIGTSDRQKTVAEKQLDALTLQVKNLIDLNENVVSVKDAITGLYRAIIDGQAVGVTRFAVGGVFTSPTNFMMGDRYGQMAEAGPEAVMPLVQTGGGLGVRAVNDNADIAQAMGAMTSEIAQLRADLRAANAAIAANTGKTARQLDRWDGEGVPVRGEAPGDPVLVETAA